MNGARGLNRTRALGVLAATGLSNGLAFAQEALIARAFGVGRQMDTYLFSMGIYTFVAAWLATSIAPSIIPSLSLLREREGQVVAQRALADASRWLLLYLGAATLVLISLSPLVPLLAGRLGAGQADLATASLRVLSPILALSGFSQTWQLLLTATGTPVRAALIPLVRPITVVIGLGVLRDARVEALPWLQLIAYAVEATVSGVVLRRRGWSIRPSFRRSSIDLRAARRQYFALALTTLLVSISPLADQLVIARMLQGGVAVLIYGQRLTAPFLVVATALTNSFFFPRALAHVAAGDSAGLRRTVDKLVVRAFAGAAVATAVLIFFARPIVALAYFRKSFTEADVQAVAEITQVAALHIPLAVIGTIVTRAMIAHNASHRLILGAALAPVVNFSLDILLARQMGLAGIALSSVGVHGYTFFYVYAALRKRCATATQQAALT